MTAQEFGEIISKRRKELSLSQEVFADKLQVSGKTVSRWETGKGFPDIAILPALCEVLDLSYYELFGLPKEKQNPETLEPIVRKVLLELKEQDRKDRKERFQKAMPYVLVAIAVMLMLAGSILMIALKKEQHEESGLSSREESDDYNDTANRALKYLQEGNYKKAYELYEKLWQKENCDNVILAWQEALLKQPLEAEKEYSGTWRFNYADAFLEYEQRIRKALGQITYATDKEQAGIDFWFNSLADLMPKNLSNEEYARLFRFLQSEKYYTKAGLVMSQWLTTEPKAELLSRYLVVEKEIKSDRTFKAKIQYEGQYYPFICLSGERQKWYDDNVLGTNDCQEGFLYVKNMKTGTILQLIDQKVDKFFQGEDLLLVLVDDQILTVSYSGTDMEILAENFKAEDPIFLQNKFYFPEDKWIRSLDLETKTVVPVVFVGEEIAALKVESTVDFLFTTQAEPNVWKKYNATTGFMTAVSDPIPVNDKTANLRRDMHIYLEIDINGDGKKEKFKITRSEGNFAELTSMEAWDQVKCADIDAYCERIYTGMPKALKNAIVPQICRSAAYREGFEPGPGDIQLCKGDGELKQAFSFVSCEAKDSRKKIYILGLEDIFERNYGAISGSLCEHSPGIMWNEIVRGGDIDAKIKTETVWLSSLNADVTNSRLALRVYDWGYKSEIVSLSASDTAGVRISFVVDLSGFDWSYNK